MTNRTASLLMLFVLALIASGVMLALAVAALQSTGWSGPWLAPLVAVLCYAAVFYVGRHAILPAALAHSATRSALVIVAMVVVTMALALAGMWAVRWVGGGQLGGAAVTLVLWYLLLWLVVRRQHRWRPA